MANIKMTKKTTTIMTPTLTGSFPAVMLRKFGKHSSKTCPRNVTFGNRLLRPKNDWISLLIVKFTKQPLKAETERGIKVVYLNLSKTYLHKYAFSFLQNVFHLDMDQGSHELNHFRDHRPASCHQDKPVGSVVFVLFARDAKNHQ